LDKKIPSAQAQKKYLALKVDPAAFASNTQLLASLSKINDWMSILTDITASTSNDDKASISSGSLKRTTSRPSLNFSAEHLAALEQYLRHDSVEQLEAWVQDAKKTNAEGNEPGFQHFLKVLLSRSISTRRKGCIACLLRHIVFLDDSDDINRRNCVHRLVVSVCRAQTSTDEEAAADPATDAEKELYSSITPAAPPSQPFKRTPHQEDRRRRVFTREDEQIQHLEYLLDNLQATQRSSLLARDSAGRTPLHFAAEGGVRIMCEIIVTHLEAWKMYNIAGGIDGPSWQDEDGFAPIHLSAMNGHPLTTQSLLDSANRKIGASSTRVAGLRSPKSSAVLAFASKANFIEVVRILVEAEVDLNYQDEQGETAIHMAARFGHADCARLLLAGNHVQKASVELAENTYAWTPLFIACVDGQLPIVELLVDAGADVDRVDSSGWTAREHAALRGHVDIAGRLAELSADNDQDTDSSTSVSSSPPTSSSISERNSNGLGSLAAIKVSDPVKTFGHRYLTEKSMILVSLGSMDARKNVKAVNLDRIPLVNAHSTQLDTALSIVVSAKGAEGEAEVIDLPVHDNISTEPIVFHTAVPGKTKLLFDLVPTYAGTRDKVVGRGVALLSSITASLGSKKMPLKGDLTVPIVSSGDLDVIGSVTFNFLIITPFKHPNMSVSEQQTYWKSMASTMVIGHRGLGKNFAAGRRSLQLGENTIQSFIAAANLGASYVEFDVQLTKDHVPVIYHDFLVSETGIDAPVHTLTLEQFLHVNDVRTPRPSRPASPAQFEHSKVANVRNNDGRQRAYRSMSVGTSSDTGDMDERMKHTRDFKKKGFKGNSRGNHIQAPFATLEEMFQQLPRDVGFNIEMKYPMLFESEDEEMDTYAVELNSFVDTVLTKVYELGKGRNIIFSSFHPDICLLLSFKQPSIPVLFLTDAGTNSVGDIRASSLQEAIRFASRWNLLGVVSAAEPLVFAPRLVRVVKESGLVCVSYGVFNNDPEKVALQVKQGIDAVIVDSVLAIRRGLTGQGKPKTDVGSGESLANVLMGSTESLEIPQTGESEVVDGNGSITMPERMAKPLPVDVSGRQLAV
jgi:glycerophosphodiester phosphodiesterase